MFGEARRLTIRPSIVAAVVFATALLASCRFPSSHRPPPLAATPRAVAATAYAQPVTPNLPASRLVATSRPAFLDLDNDGEDDRNDEREEDEANDPDRIGPDGHRRIGNDHPLEAVRFRTLSLQDQSGRIADNGLMAAAGHVRNMRGAQPPEAGAGISRGAWTWLGPGNIGGRIRALAIHPTATSTMFAGSVSGGIWRTTNGGAAWANFPAEDEPFTGGVRVGLADLDGDGLAEIVTGSGPGGGRLRLFRGPGGAPVASLTPFGESFDDGLFVGAFSQGGGAPGPGGSGGRPTPSVTVAATTNGAEPSTNAVFTLTRTDTTGASHSV